MLKYKVSYSNNNKSQSIKKAQKIVRKRLRLEKKQQQRQATEKQNNKIKVQKSEKQYSSSKIRPKCNSQIIYSSFSKNNFEISNLQKINQNMKMKTSYHKKIISTSLKQSRKIVEPPFQISSKSSSVLEQKFLKKSIFSKRVNTEQQKNSCLKDSGFSTKRVFRLLSNPSQRMSRLTQRKTKQFEKELNNSQVGQQKKEVNKNSYLKKQLAKKTNFLRLSDQQYTACLPIIKEKRIHMR